MTYTADQVAYLIKVSGSKVRKECKRLGIQKFGSNYIIEENEIQLIKSTCKTRGRKKKVTND